MDTPRRIFLRCRVRAVKALVDQSEPDPLTALWETRELLKFLSDLPPDDPFVIQLQRLEWELEQPEPALYRASFIAGSISYQLLA